MRAALLGLSLLTAAPLVSGCATKPTDSADLAQYKENNDPYEPLNRKLYKVQDVVDKNALRPVAVAYRDNVPNAFRSHLHNVLSNLANPVQFCNDVLQGKPRKVGDTFVRTMLNTTVGIGGVFDVATGLGYPDHDTDFGLTLALWGAPSGPFLFLPFIGPSDVRDGVGYGVSTIFNPFTWASFGGSNAFGFAQFGLGALDARTRALTDTDSIEKSSLDPYAAYRSLYTQHRAAQIEAGRKDRPETVPDWYASASPTPAIIPQPAPVPPSQAASPANGAPVKAGSGASFGVGAGVGSGAPVP